MGLGPSRFNGTGRSESGLLPESRNGMGVQYMSAALRSGRGAQVSVYTLRNLFSRDLLRHLVSKTQLVPALPAEDRRGHELRREMYGLIILAPRLFIWRRVQCYSISPSGDDRGSQQALRMASPE